VKPLKSILLASLLVLNASARAQTRGVQPQPSYPELFRAIWQTVNDNFYDPNFAGVDWRAVRERYRPQVGQVKDDRAFLALMGKMLKELPVSHLRVVAGAQNTAGVNARAHSLEGQLVVADVPLVSDARRQGLRAGDIILTPLNELAGAAGSEAALRVRGCDGRERSLAVRREPFSAERPVVAWQQVGAQPGRRVGYLRVRHFDDDAVPQIDAAMNELKGTAGLIIDLRDNAGGTNSFARLVSYLVPGQQLLSGLLTRPYLALRKGAPVDPATLTKMIGVYSLDKLLLALMMNGAIALYTEDMGDKVYRGKVILLTNGVTASAAEGFVAYLRRGGRATVVGRTTAGQLLTSNMFPLPNGWRLVVPIAVPVAPDGSWFKDTPLPPDIEVKWTRQDVCDGRDPDIAKALEVLSQEKK
jgi:carboxyl-terminal processing protease